MFILSYITVGCISVYEEGALGIWQMPPSTVKRKCPAAQWNTGQGIGNA
jgi:hypothetical protein